MRIGGFISFILSLSVHAGFAGVAYSLYELPQEKASSTVVNYVEILPKPKELPRKEVAPEVTVASTTQEGSPAPAPKLLTQKQKSPVRVKVSAKKVAQPSPKIRDARSLKQLPGNPLPYYSMADRMAGYSGRVTVMGYVNKKGHTENLTIENSSVSSRMEQEALLAFSKYRFEKGQSGWVRMPFEFILEGPAKKLSVRDRYRFVR